VGGNVSITAEGGTLKILGSVAGDIGLLEIDQGATLELSNATDQDIYFDGSLATLKLDAPTAFTGYISEIVVGDTIDLAGITASSANYSGSTLTINETNGQQLIYNNVSGSLAGEIVATASDNNGGTLVYWTKPSESWLTGVAGDWSVAADWQSGVVPSSTDDAVINNSSAVTVDGVAVANSLALDTSTPTVSGSLTLGASLNVDGGQLTLSGGTLSAQSITSGSGSGATGGSLWGYGTVSGTVGGNVSITAEGGTLKILGSVAGDIGLLEIDQGATLELSNATDQDIYFDGSLATLKLDAPTAFTGYISEIVVGDTIDLAGITASSASYSGSTLTINETNGQQLIYNNVSGSLAGEIVTVASDNNGGTLVYWTQPSVVAITSAGGLTSQPVQMISGTAGVADAGATLTVLDGTTEVGTAKVQADGNWSVGVTLWSGAQTIMATQTLPDDEVGSNAVGYTLSATAPATGILESLTPSEEIAAIYLGYFDRAPASVGFSFWEGQYSQALANGQSRDQALQNIANSFTPQSETLALYPFLSTTTLDPNSPTDVSGVENLIDNIFANLFDRAPAEAGMQYWSQQLLSGAVPLGLAILDIANGAQGADANIVLNKVVVSDYFVAEDTAAGIGLTSPLPASLLPEAHAILLGVTSDLATITTAENTIDAFVAGTASVITGTINDDTLTGGSKGGDIIFPAGGADTINLSSTSHASETIYFGATVSAAATAIVPITNASGVTQQGFWGNGAGGAGLSASTSADMSVVDNFTAGAAGDIIGFDFMAWGSGGTVNGAGTELGLVQGDAETPVGVGGATLDTVAAAGATLAANADLVEDGVATYADAAALASALSSDSGYFLLAGNGLAAHDEAHMLVAYSTGSSVNIADVLFDNTTSAAQVDTAHLTVTASDMAQLGGLSLASLTAHNIALVA
jgi:hypothetical protein